MKDLLGDRVKFFENITCKTQFTPLLPLYVRLDGKNFSKFTKKFTKPYDVDFAKCMAETTKYLVEETNALIGYTQSDEISLIIYSSDIKSQIYFNGRVQKILSVLASKTSIKLYQECLNGPKHISERATTFMPVFDARAYTVPTKELAAITIMWREIDAIRNSKNLLAQQYFSHKSLQNVSSRQAYEMLKNINVDYDSYTSDFKRGMWFAKRPVEMTINYNGTEQVIIRNKIQKLDLPVTTTLENLVEVIFDKAQPIVKKIENNT